MGRIDAKLPEARARVAGHAAASGLDAGMSSGRPVGFIGLGSMGEPMALNLVKAGVGLVVWNRTPEKSGMLADAGATVAADVSDVFARSDVVILMLLDDQAMDEVLMRDDPAFGNLVRGHTLINMATTSPKYSQGLEADVRAAGGQYVEAPVSGSRKPAESAQLVAMLAGESATVECVRPVLAPMCRSSVFCGAVPKALLMKLAVNQFMITMTAGLAEGVHFARSHGLDVSQLVTVLDAGPMASDYTRIKAAKLLASDFAVQGAASSARDVTRLIRTAARDANIASPLIDVCDALYEETVALGFAGTDIVAVIHAIEHRTAPPG